MECFKRFIRLYENVQLLHLATKLRDEKVNKSKQLKSCISIMVTWSGLEQTEIIKHLLQYHIFQSELELVFTYYTEINVLGHLITSIVYIFRVLRLKTIDVHALHQRYADLFKRFFCYFSLMANRISSCVLLVIQISRCHFIKVESQKFYITIAWDLSEDSAYVSNRPVLLTKPNLIFQFSQSRF